MNIGQFDYELEVFTSALNAVIEEYRNKHKKGRYCIQSQDFCIVLENVKYSD